MNTHGSWLVRTVTMVVWASAAASVVWWGLRLWSGASQTPSSEPPPSVAPAPVADQAAVARLLGALAPAGPAMAPVAVNRFVLLGVMASPSKMGSALIAVDGKPGRAFRVGSKVDDGIVLDAVEPRKARLAPVGGAGEPIFLEMPLLSKPQSTGGRVVPDGRSSQPAKASVNPS